MDLTPVQTILKMRVSEMLVKTGLCQSRSQAIRKIKEGAVFANGERVTDAAAAFEEYRILRVGQSRSWSADKSLPSC